MILAVITADSIEVKRDGAEVDREEHKILWSVEDAQKAGYEHFMLKEIHEQPKVIRDTLGNIYRRRNRLSIWRWREVSAWRICSCWPVAPPIMLP